MIERGIAVGDNHGCEADPVSVKCLFNFMADFKPQHRIHLGDCFDWTAIRTKANPSEESKGLGKDTEAGMRFLRRFRPTVFLMGNHEARLYQLRDKCVGTKREYAELCIDEVESKLDNLGCVVFPYHAHKGVYRLGGVSFLHGYSCGVAAAREHAAAYGTCVMGHLHRNEVRQARRVEGATCYVAGGLYLHEAMTYAHTRLATLEWNHGAVAFEYNCKTGRTRLWHVPLGQS